MSTTSNSLWQARAKLMKRLVPVVREILFSNRFDSPSKKQRIEALELTELVVFHIGLSLRELSNFKTPNGRIALKNLVELLRQIRSEFFSACSEGLHYMDYNYTGAPQRLRESIKRKCAQIYNIADLENSHPFYEEKIQSLTWSWPRIIEISGLESRGRFEAYVENAKNVFMNWFRTFFKEGREAALLQLREELWTDSEKATEAQLVATKVQVFDDLASRIEPPAAALPASFPKFPDFPVELQLKIWGHTFESRTVEIQFYVSEPPKWDEVMRWRNGKGNLYFQKVARSGFRTDVPMIEVWKTWDAEFSAQQRMHYDARPRQYVRAPPPPPPPPPMEDWEERYVDSLHSGGAEIGGFPLESLDNDDAEGWVDDAGPAEYSGFVQPGYGPPGFFPPGSGPPGSGPPGSGPPGSGPPGFGPSGFPPGFGPESDPADVLAAGYTMPGFQTEPEEDPSDRTGLFKSPAPPPVALFVTKQSRAEALRFYKKRFITPGHQDSGIYVDFDHDEILLDIETFGRCIFKNAPQDADELVRWLGWHGGLSKIDMESRSGIKNLSMSVRLLDPRWFYDRRKIMRRFPSLQRLSLIHKTTSVFDYRLVTDYRIHQIYNKKFPKHKNQFFEEPFIRYLDKSLSWFPGSDHPSNTQGMRRTNDGTQAYGHINEDPYPGVYPIGEDFISKLQRCKVSFEDIGNQKYPYQRREVVGFGPDSDGDDDFNFNDYNFDDDDSDGDDFYGNIVDDDNSDEGDESDGDDSHGDDSHGDDSHGYNSNGGVGHGNNHQRDEIPNGLQVRSVRLWRGKPKGPIKVFSRQNRPQRPSRSGASSMSGTSQDSPGNKEDEEDEDGWSDSVADDDARWYYDEDEEEYWFRRNKVWSKYKQPKEITIEKSVYEHDLIAFEALLRATAW